MTEVLNSAAWMAHGYCLLWTPWLVALHAIPDVLIFLSYTAIPIALLRVVRRRSDIEGYAGLVVLFASFILFCGVTHLMGLITLWFPIYAIQGALKAITAGVSLTTAIVLFRLVPSLIAIPSPSDLAMTNDRLQAEIDAHEMTLAALREAQADLEEKVAERTADLETANNRLRVVTRETVHRKKNLLTVVASLARQTARGASNKEEFVEAFMGRLNALARATDLVVAREDVSTGEVGMRAVVEGQLEHYVEAYQDRFSVEGPNTGLRTEAAQQIGLIIHELATNAVKYGALARDSGKITVTWSEGDGEFRFEWREVLPQAEAPEGQPGFGTGLLTRAIPSQLGAEARFELTPTGAVYELTLPRESLRPADHTTAMEKTLEAYA